MLRDLEIGISQYDDVANVGRRYIVDLRYKGLEEGDDSRWQSPPMPLVIAPFGPADDALSYGRRLWDALFADPQLRDKYGDVKTPASGKDPLRVRLYLSPNSPELYNRPWELLHDTTANQRLCTDERVHFSRYGLTSDWRPLRPPPGPNELTALLVIANPAAPGMAPVAVKGESERARTALALPPARVVEYSEAAAQRATLENLLKGLRDGADVLYLVGHGQLVRDEPWLYLETADGQVDRVNGRELVQRLRELPQLPRLIVLASCQSAGNQSADSGALAALGPRLVAAGVPAVIAMQGNIRMDTVAAFMPRFFTELNAHGVIDKAFAVARGYCAAEVNSVPRCPDWWMPVLIHRLRQGQLWGEERSQPGQFGKWNPLIGRLQRGQCTAVLGSGMVRPILGESRRTAELLAERHRFPLRPQDRDDLPQVAQYLRVIENDISFPRYEVEKCLSQHVRLVSAAAAARPADTPLDELILAAAPADPDDVHTLLARLPFRTFVTTNGDSLLEHALAAAGKTPLVGLFAAETTHWTAARTAMAAGLPAVAQLVPPDGRLPAAPTAQAPLVYHLYGHWRHLESLVLTEDDYFDHLIQFIHGSDDPRIPRELLDKLVNATLVFLGFRLEEWDFRVLLRTINALGGSDMLGRNIQVAVQINPGGSRFADPEKARQFLEQSTQLGRGQVAVFWGELPEFLRQIANRLQQAGGP